MSVFIKDRQIVFQPTLGDIRELLIRLFTQIIESAEEIPRVKFCILMKFLAQTNDVQHISPESYFAYSTYLFHSKFRYKRKFDV